MPIRKFEKADIKPLTDIVRATGVFREEEIEIAVELMDIAANDKDQKDYILFTAVDEKEIVQGYYCFGPTPMTKATYDLYWIAVNPATQRTGIGYELLMHCEDQIQQREGKLVVVETSSQPKYEATRKFYLKHRYNETARIKSYYAPDDDLVIYSKHF